MEQAHLYVTANVKSATRKYTNNDYFSAGIMPRMDLIM